MKWNLVVDTDYWDMDNLEYKINMVAFLDFRKILQNWARRNRSSSTKMKKYCL
jgi:hypothetical protein